MNNEALQRTSDVIHDSVVLENVPIHIAGATLLLQNQSAADTVLSIAESADGVAYTAVPFSTPTAGSNLTLNVVGLSSAVVLFSSASKYVRLSVASFNGDGLRFSMVQFEPRTGEAVSTY